MAIDKTNSHAMLRFLSFLFFLCTFAHFSFAQLSIPLTPGAKGLSMGGTGLNAQDVHAAWANPAGLSNLNAIGFAFYGEQRFSLSELKQVSAAAAMPAGKNGGLGLTLGYFGFDAYNEQRVGIAYGRKLAKNISMGVQMFAWSTRIPEYGNKTAMSFELGVQGRISPEVSLAAKLLIL